MGANEFGCKAGFGRAEHAMVATGVLIVALTLGIPIFAEYVPGVRRFTGVMRVSA